VAGTTTLTLPAATDTLVGKATTDTLTNKTLTGAAMNGTLGATTPSTVAATTLTTSSTVTHNGGTANGVGYLDGSKVLTTGSALVFDGTNLGVGVTPSAWSWRALQVGSFGGFFATNSAAYASYLGNNAYYDGSNWRYIASSGAVHYELASGDRAHKWYTAASGTAGNTITFTQAMTLDASGNLSVTSVANPGYGIYVNRNLASTYALGLQNSTNNTGNNFVVFINYLGNTAGAISQNAIATVNYGTASDYRLKENITPMVSALNKVAQLKPVTYKWKDSGEESQGFIAHELQSVLSDCVVGEKDAIKQEQYEITPAVKDEQGNILTPAEIGTRTVPVYQMVDTSFLVATLTAAIQEQQAIIQTLTARITALESA
jgi:hypothetical protein